MIASSLSLASTLVLSPHFLPRFLFEALIVPYSPRQIHRLGRTNAYKHDPRRALVLEICRGLARFRMRPFTSRGMELVEPHRTRASTSWYHA